MPAPIWKHFVTSALLRTPYYFNALPVLDDTAIVFAENSIPRDAVSKQCPGNLNEVLLVICPAVVHRSAWGPVIYRGFDPVPLRGDL